MKRIIFILIILITGTINAQVPQLEQKTPENYNPNTGYDKLYLTPDLIGDFGSFDTLRSQNAPQDVYVNIYIHALRREQAPFGGVSIETINRYLKTLYTDFDPLGIHFVWDGKIRDVKNNGWYGTPQFNIQEIFDSNNQSNGIDIFLADELATGSGASGTPFAAAAGIGTDTKLIVGGYFYLDTVKPLSFTKVISHVMGNVLFLLPTHYGTQGHGFVHPDFPTCPELVNGDANNRENCGDFIADTPADPNLFIWNVNPDTCRYEPQFFYEQIPPVDANGDEYEPDTGNIMSLSHPTCYKDFTYLQGIRMKNALLNIPVLNQTVQENYLYARTENECFVCSDNNNELEFSIHSNSSDVNVLNISSSSNITTSIIDINNGNFTLKITSLLSPLAEEGERAWFSVHGNGAVGILKNIWLGKPQTVPEFSLYGTEEVNAGDGAGHVLTSRLNGMNTYEWLTPQPSAIVWGGELLDDTVWQHFGYDKYFMFSSAYAGNQTGVVSVVGKNPCGLGLNGGNSNEICVINFDDPDPDGDTCDGFDDEPILYYPNPADSLLEIDLSLQEFKVFTILIYDELQSVKYSGESTNVIKTVDMFNLPNGTYYLHIYDDNNEIVLSRTLIINH